MMIKRFLSYSILFFLLPSVFAQIPDGYYDDATGTGYTLKTQLHNIIKNHTSVSYTPGVWNAFSTTDVREDGYVWDTYSNCDFVFGDDQDSGSGGTSECEFYNREHSFPRAWFGGTEDPMNTDLFHIMPTDKYVNGQRGNLEYGEVNSPSQTFSNGSKIGACSYPGYSGTVFEPIDDYKGDFARNYFYMVTRYEDLIFSWPGSNMLDGSNDQCFSDWALEMLMSWHNDDPVSEKELDRNNAVYNIQSNRNPFIDHPEFVAQIWGGGENLLPSISNVEITPANPTSADAVSVSATITDSDGNITNAELHWGLSSGSLSNTINMTHSAGDIYISDTDIPAQADGTIVYFEIEATDDSAAINTSSTQSYTVNDEGTFGLPFEEDFETVTLNEPISIDGWLIFNEAGTTSWEGREYNSNKYAQMSAYNTGEASNISWLITPEIDLSNISSAQFSFKSKDGYNNGEVLTALISNDYSGSGDPNIASWNELNVEIANNAPSNGYASEFVFSGELDFSSYIDQTIYIAFKYVGGDGSVTTTMQIDDVLITGESTSNATPEISNITISPENPESNDSVDVSATITDSDGTISATKIKWGTSTGDYTNEETMNSQNGDTYFGVIPSQPDQTTVFYVIEAEDNEGGVTISNENNYQVVDTENQAPVISDVVLNPENPTNDDNVIISASVVDSDGSLKSVVLKWKKDSEAYNEQEMNLSGGKYYGQISKQPAGTTIVFSIVATDDLDAETIYENTYEVSEANAINDLKTNDLKIFPNPASKVVNIYIPEFTGKIDFKLYNALGVLILDETQDLFNGPYKINLNGIKPGIYFINISNELVTTTKRLIIKP